MARGLAAMAAAASEVARRQPCRPFISTSPPASPRLAAPSGYSSQGPPMTQSLAQLAAVTIARSMAEARPCPDLADRPSDRQLRPSWDRTGVTGSIQAVPPGQSSQSSHTGCGRKPPPVQGLKGDTSGSPLAPLPGAAALAAAAEAAALAAAFAEPGEVHVSYSRGLPCGGVPVTLVAKDSSADSQMPKSELPETVELDRSDKTDQETGLVEGSISCELDACQPLSEESEPEAIAMLLAARNAIQKASRKSRRRPSLCRRSFGQSLPLLDEELALDSNFHVTFLLPLEPIGFEFTNELEAAGFTFVNGHVDDRQGSDTASMPSAKSICLLVPYSDNKSALVTLRQVGPVEALQHARLRSQRAARAGDSGESSPESSCDDYKALPETADEMSALSTALVYVVQPRNGRCADIAEQQLGPICAVEASYAALRGHQPCRFIAALHEPPGSESGNPAAPASPGEEVLRELQARRVGGHIPCVKVQRGDPHSYRALLVHVVESLASNFYRAGSSPKKGPRREDFEGDGMEMQELGLSVCESSEVCGEGALEAETTTPGSSPSGGSSSSSSLSLPLGLRA
ncbi:unnamed protein product [Polarella glacialis]|uniref:Uncharacterized protein n=1 Tax=Polarella glacialis TaxID=89957 RepID=A0A813DAG1_POLGL|nr:unnamed protein product [Polarella glacialis]